MRTFSLPSLRGNAGKVLTVSSDEENTEWGSGGGGGGDPTIGNPVIGATPNLFLYVDASGNLYQDPLAFRDSVTNETYIGYRTGLGQFTNELKLGNFLGGFIADGTGIERHDSVNDNFTFWSAIDGTPLGGEVNTLVGGYIDFTNSILSTATFDEFEVGFDYQNSVLQVGGSININDSNASIFYSDNGNTFATQTVYQSNGIQTQYTNIGANANTQLFTGDGFISGGDRFNERNSMTFNLDDNSQQFYVKGLKNGGNLGDMLNLNAQFGTMRMGDTTEISSRVFYEVNDTNGFARVHGLQSKAPNWTPTFLSDGFTGTGLNDMHYDSTITYTGSYPRTYTSTISATDCVYLLLTSIISPSFNAGDTVTDPVSGSTGTVLAGSDLDLYLIIKPIIDSGWNTATQVDDITTGGSANCSFQRYTDTFDWNDGTTFETYRDTNIFVPLNDGLTVGFYAPTGHTIGDSWQFTMIQGTNYTDMAFFDGVNKTMSIGDVDGVSNKTLITVDDNTGTIKLTNKVALNTPAVQATTATLGSVFTLTNIFTGEGEWAAGVTKTHEYFDSYTGSTITLADTPTFIYLVSKNGQVLSEGISRDYTVSGTTITFAVALLTDNIQVVYEY